MQRRNTPARSAILEELRQSDAALSHEMLERALDKSINRATIYRVLKRLETDSVVHRVVTAEGIQYFALCAGCEEDEHHHRHLHFRCLSCDRVECLPQELSPRLPEGYRSVGLNGTVSGYCSGCDSAPAK